MSVMERFYNKDRCLDFCIARALLLLLLLLCSATMLSSAAAAAAGDRETKGGERERRWRDGSRVTMDASQKAKRATRGSRRRRV